ncbi:lytic transglycosylase domain-containing protein [Serratia symbiotica]|uniref:Lytic transglycosylase domain-containing protein n=1 Tax=Serratia symbiotica TaxID=138074 RepID=A0A068Z4C2_9GAMM|nr:lytic transglycosylase domain-containing protein [Serratia symbiotica]CDS57032.1 Peptidoglycan-binding-like protein [Serratia symbiotica]
MWYRVIGVLLLLVATSGMLRAATLTPDIARCFQDAGLKFRVDWRLLLAIAEVESGLDPRVIGLNKKNGQVRSEDIGLMQINSAWLPALKPLGITRAVLLNNPCQNIHVGAWILARNIEQNGVNWTSVGAYNAGFRNTNAPFRMRYARKVYDRYLRLTSTRDR